MYLGCWQGNNRVDPPSLPSSPSPKGWRGGVGGGGATNKVMELFIIQYARGCSHLHACLLLGRKDFFKNVILQPALSLVRSKTKNV
jgi:hypothetical protein